MKNILYFTMVIMTAVFLIGCTSGEKEGTPDNNGTKTNNSSNVTNENPNQSGQGGEKVTPNQPTENKTDEENKLTYTSKGKEISIATKVVESENQNFKISLLPDFSLSAEEPGKDVILFDSNDRVFMRIETIAVTDSNYKDMLQATEEFMRASSNDGTTTEDANVAKLAPSTAKNASAFVNNSGEDKTTALLFETDELFVRLTVFDTKSLDLTDAFLKMGTTIDVK